MRINKNAPIFEKSKIKLETNSSNKDDQNRNNSNSNKNNINKIFQPETQNETNDLSSPAPSLFCQSNLKKINKTKLYEMFVIEIDKEYFRLFFYINEEDNLVIELIPKNGNLPFSYKNIFNAEKFYKINKIFMELKTIEKIGEKIINLFKKGKAILTENKKEGLFYLILKITIIDEDIDVFIALNKNEDVQICTINYLLKESEKLKNDFNIYRDQTEELIKNQDKEINELKKSNSLYLNIIKRLNNEYEQNKKDNFKDILNNEKENVILLNENREEEFNENDEEELKKIDEIIIDENEEYEIIKTKIETMEKELKNLNNNYKCVINGKYKILNLTINQTKPYIYIFFELLNIGLYPLTCQQDDIFCNLEDINENLISFYDEDERYILFPEPLQPNQKMIISKKIKINNPNINRKYDFILNIYSLNHGKISEEPIRFNIFIRDKEDQASFISFLNNKNLNLDFKNKKKNIILEYLDISDEKIENNFKPINNDLTKEREDITIKKFIYDEKSEMALENKNINIIDKNEANHINNDNLDVTVIINKEDINKLVKKIKLKYKRLDKFDKKKIIEIICSCLGEFNTICAFIEKMV